jgi:NADH:ubiquinone oxidoreductase subunit F (NADH-binding)
VPLLAGTVRLPRSRDGRGQLPAEDLRAHHERVGPRPTGSPELVGIVEHAGLTGQGGAHAPTAARWRRAVDRVPGVRVVVANGAESEPLSGKDATLLRARPHLVLDGLELVAETLGASRAVVWLHGDDVSTFRAVAAAVSERAAGPLAGPEPAGWGGRRVRAEVVLAPAHYLAGERSAIGRALSGGPVLPVGRPAPDAQRPDAGVLVHNVETLARVAVLARGLTPSPARLVTVLTPTARVVMSVPPGQSARHVLARAGWQDEPQAVLLGGYGGQWVPWSTLADRALDEPELRRLGLSAGPGIVAPLPAWACGVAETAAITAYLATMSAGQCGPCLFGLPALADHLGRLASGRATRRERTGLMSDLGLVDGRGGCHHPDGVVRLVRSALTTFAAEVDAHTRGAGLRGGGHRVSEHTRAWFIPVPITRE